MPTQRTVEYNTFDIAADFGHLIRGIDMRNPLNGLLNNRTFVEISRHEVSRGTDQLDPTVVSLMVRFCTFKAGQKGMVNIDRPAIKFLAQIVRENLHIAR